MPIPVAMTNEALEAERERGLPILIREDVVRAINAALLLRRPLLVTGKPGIGKSSIIARVAYELKLGPVLRWPINSRSTVKRGLYEYDAIARLQAQQNQEKNAALGDFLRLGPLGTALYPRTWPRALLIDEIDKGDIDLPNDLLNVLEEGSFEIDELKRAKLAAADVRAYDSDRRLPIADGTIKADQFPFIVMTSNGEREFPAPLLRRCIRIKIDPPSPAELDRIVMSHLGRLAEEPERLQVKLLIERFVSRSSREDLATDQLLNAVFVILRGGAGSEAEFDKLCELLYAGLTSTSVGSLNYGPVSAGVT